MKPRILTLVMACSLLLGCKPVPLTVAPSSVAALQPPLGGTSAVTDPQLKTGTLMLSVRWPERSYSGFNAQAIPLSTNALVVDITDAKGIKVAHEVLKRTSGTLQTTKEMVLSVGTGYQVSVKAYAETDPTDGDEVIAQANAVDVAVTWNVVSPLKVSLAPLFAPIIEGLSASNAGVGAFLELTGTNFGRGGGSPSVIFPSGTTLTGTLVDGRIRVAVPASAGSGNLKVKVDGIVSGTSVTFRELTQLSLAATSSTDDVNRLDSDGVIRTWLGDSFQLTPQASDSSGSALADPTITSWSNASSSIGSMDASGSYRVTATQISTLDTDLVTANSGQVSASRQVVVAPPAGPTLHPHPLVDPVVGTPAYDPKDKPGSSEGVAITKFGDRYLVAWATSGYSAIAWRVLNQDGTPATPIKYITSYRYLKEAQPLLASRGNDAVLMIRYNNVQTQLVAYQIGADLTPLAYIVVDTTRSDMDSADAGRSVYLGNLASNGTNYMLGYYVMEPDGYHYKTRTFTYDTNAGNLSLKTVDASAYPVVTDQGILRNFASDRASLTTDGSNYYVRLYYDKSGVGKYFWTKFLSDGSQDPTAKSVTTAEPERCASDATSGNTYLFTSIDYLNASNTAIYSMVDMSFNPLKGRTVIGTLDGAITDPINYPIRALWDGTQYLVCYTRMRQINGVPTPQPMVQAIAESGPMIGKAYPIEGVGSKVTLVRLDGEGAWCLWADGDNVLQLRKLKYR